MSEAPAEPVPAIADRPDWRGAVQRIRDASAWITKSFVAAGAVLIGSGPLVVGLADLTWGPRAVVVILGAAAALLGIVLVIRSATQVMLPETTDLAEIVTASSGPLRALRERVETPIGRRIYLGSAAPTVHGLIDAIEGWQRSVEVLAQYDQQVKAFESQRPKPDESSLPPALQTPAARALIPTTLASARATLQLLTSRAFELVKHGVYVEVRATFRMARRTMFAGGALAALGVAVYVAAVGIDPAKAEKPPQPAAAQQPVSIETLTWRTAQPEDGRPVDDVRQAFGLQGRACDTVPVVVLEGVGSRANPWKVTTIGGGPCAAAPRTFRIDDRYADVMSEPPTVFTLDEPDPPPQLSIAILLGALAGAVVFAVGWALVRVRRP